MGKCSGTEEIVLLFDSYSLESKNLHSSFMATGKNYPAVVIEDDGFLPDNVISVYSFFLGDFKESAQIPGKPRFFNQIKVPEHWEISGNNANGKVHDLKKERGRIYYAAPAHKRLVRIVDWLDDSGVVRSSDHYNKYGALYARTVFNAKGQRVNKSYFSADGKEIIVENYVTRNIILNEGDVVRIFQTKEEFVRYFLMKAGLDDKRLFFNSLSTPFFVSQRLKPGERKDVLFWQEPVGDEIPGNMRIILDGKSNRTCYIMVQRRDAYEKLVALGANQEMLQCLGFVYSLKRKNNHRPHALICTNSDNIEQFEKLVEAVPNLHFHVAAITEMSTKLSGMDIYDNVTLYPGVKANIAEDLFAKCDYYLDINHEKEILFAVQTAFMNNQVIFAFEETKHNLIYTAKEHIYKAADADRMIADLKAVLSDKNLTEEYLDRQHKAALLEKEEAFLQFVEG